MRLRRAQCRTTRTLERFDFARLPKLNQALVHDLATGRYLREKVPVLLVGPSGIGKRHLALALGHCAERQGVNAVFTGCAALTHNLSAARATGIHDRKLAALARVSLLMIDDNGRQPLRASADEDLHDLIAAGPDSNPASQRSSEPAPPPTCSATKTTAALSGGSNRASALRLNDRPYHATVFLLRRALGSRFTEATTIVNRGASRPVGKCKRRPPGLAGSRD